MQFAELLAGHPGADEIASVTFAHAFCPDEVKFTVTIQRPVLAPFAPVSMPAVALATASPPSRCGPSAYSIVPVGSQATIQSLPGALATCQLSAVPGFGQPADSLAVMHGGGVPVAVAAAARQPPEAAVDVGGACLMTLGTRKLSCPGLAR
jgi:hypothetical protein